MKRGGYLQRRTPLQSYTSLKLKSPLRATGTKKEKSSSPKKKQPSISKLKKNLWTIFSLYIRTRDNYTCFTCDRKGEGSGMHAGHFITKAVGGITLYFHEENVHAQCYNCNINLSGNIWEYGQRLGAEKVAELYKLKQITAKWSITDYEGKIAHYKQKLHELQTND
jgi:hypothetical protein